MNSNYKTFTIKELIKILTALAKEMPKGYNTPVYSGDFEGNYTHIKHEIMRDEENGAVFLGYEMHENYGD